MVVFVVGAVCGVSRLQPQVIATSATKAIFARTPIPFPMGASYGTGAGLATKPQRASMASTSAPVDLSLCDALRRSPAKTP
jgi:hypothetical protein